MTSAQSTPPSDDLDSEIARAIREGDWAALEQWMSSGQLSDDQKAKVVVEWTRYANVKQSARHIKPFCSSGQLESAVEELISAGLWTNVADICLSAGSDHLQWRVGDLSISGRLLSVVAEGKWKELGRVFQGDHSPQAQRSWAVLQASQRAGQLEIMEDVFPHCAKGDWDGVLQHLVSRGLWWVVGSVLGQHGVVSEAQRSKAMEQALQTATSWELSEFVLPHCHAHHLVSMSKHLLTRQLWWAMENLLMKDAHLFSQFVMPVFGSAGTDLFMSHLLMEGLLKSAQRLMQIVEPRKLQWKLGDVSIDSNVVHLVAEEKWTEVALNSDGSVLAWALELMSKKAKKNEINRLISSLCPIRQLHSMLKNLVERKFMDEATILLCQLVRVTLIESADIASHYRMMMDLFGGTVNEVSDINKCAKGSEEALWNLLTNKNLYLGDISVLSFKAYDVECTYDFMTSNDRAWSSSDFGNSSPDDENQMVGQILFDSALNIVLMSFCDRLNALPDLQSVDDEVQLALSQVLKQIKPAYLQQEAEAMQNDFFFRNDSDPHPVFALSFIFAVMKYMFIQQQWTYLPRCLLIYLTTVPVVPEVQRNAVRTVLTKKAWDLLGQSDLSHVGEETRRLLFWSAVRHKQWGLVSQWADHTLHDDQRRWALEEASKNNGWHVCPHLAEHGLTKEEMMRVHCFAAENGDKRDILLINEHGSVNVEEELTVLKSQMLKGDEAEDKTALEQALTEGNWQKVVLIISERLVVDCVSPALRAVMGSQAWSKLKKLVRLESPECDQLPMVRQQQWGVCRAMVDQGLGAELYEQFIPHLMEHGQWTVVGNMMRYVTDDAVRRQVMQRALQRKEGTVVSQCITGMKQRLSVKEREDLFHRATVCGVLQAVKPLVIETDETGVRHRDLALQHAINRQQWDVMDLCLQHHAHINVPDERGDLPVHRAARRCDWDTVLVLAERGANLSVLDSTGLSVMHMAIRTQQWSHMETLIQFCDNLQIPATHQSEKRTALELLTDTELHLRYGFTEALTQKNKKLKGRNGRGETAIHAITLAGWYKLIRHLLLQESDPLLVTYRGHSALTYAVLSKRSTQTTVAECISLGFSTHQPHITHSMQKTGELFLSPVLFAVMCGLPTVVQMLYESGSISSKEMFQILPHLIQLTDSNHIQTTANLVRSFKTDFLIICSKDHTAPEGNNFGRNPAPGFRQASEKLIKKAALYLVKASQEPRSLKSMCRLVVSHCVRISGTRHEDISQLPIPKSLQDYVSFADLTQPDFGQRRGGGTDDAGEYEGDGGSDDAGEYEGDGGSDDTGEYEGDGGSDDTGEYEEDVWEEDSTDEAERFYW